MAINAIERPVFKPAMRVITAITNSNPAIVTTSFSNSYITGLIVRMYVPNGYGMTQINGMTGVITVLDGTTFSLPIDTTTFDIFAEPDRSAPPLNRQYAQVVPIGEVGSLLRGAVTNVLPYSVI